MFGFAVHVPSSASTERAEQVFRDSIAAEWPGVLIAKPGERRPRMSVVNVMSEGASGFDASYVRSVGKGLSKAQARLLEGAHTSIAAFVMVPTQDAPIRLQSLLRATARAADALDGVGDDLGARIFLTSDELRRRAEKGLENGIPVALEHVALHSYRISDGTIRTVSVGALKLGLPNVVVQSHAPSTTAQIAALLNLVLQALAEGQPIGPGGTFDLALATLKARGLAEIYRATMKEGGVGKLRLTLTEGKREDGDDAGGLIEVRFDAFAGDPFVQQAEAMKRFFGSSDAVVWADSSKAAKARTLALERLETLRAGFEERLEKHERLLVKAPFDTDSGSVEWMWVEVLSWKGREMRGVLENVPDDIAALKVGMRVTVSQDDLFDYIRVFPDGTKEGNTTAQFLAE